MGSGLSLAGHPATESAKILLCDAEPQPEGGRGLHLRRVLVCTDTSSVSCRAVGVAELVCRRADAELTLLHVTQCPPSPAGIETAAVEIEVSEQRHKVLGAMVVDMRSRGLNAHLRDIVGYPSSAILAEIALEQADLVVLATHGTQGS